MESYCVKCKSKRKVVDPQLKHAKNGRPFIVSDCETCGSTCSRFVKQNEVKEGGLFWMIPGLFGKGKKRVHVEYRTSN